MDLSSGGSLETSIQAGAYNTILFDLDGTLTDPGIGITNSVAYALKHYNISVEEREELFCFIGPPLMDSFQEFYNFTEEQAEQAVVYYREYYREKGIFENHVYPGMEELLAKLKAAGKTLLVATSKPEEFSTRILEKFQLADYFTFIAGATMDTTRNTKADVIRYALERGKVTNKSSALMIGDRKYDILGAKEVGIASMGILFGYGSREELESAGADMIAETVEDIYTIIMGK